MIERLLIQRIGRTVSDGRSQISRRTRMSKSQREQADKEGANPVTWGVKHVRFSVPDSWRVSVKLRYGDLRFVFSDLAWAIGLTCKAAADPGTSPNLRPDFEIEASLLGLMIHMI